jgi:hypothetical protein
MYSVVTQDDLSYSLTTEDGFALVEPGDGWYLLYNGVDDVTTDLDQNLEFEEIADEIIDWTETDPFSEGGNY